MTRDVAADAGVASPCRKICAVDGRSGTCIGCGRTLAEISAWPTLSDLEKRGILDRLHAAGAATL